MQTYAWLGGDGAVTTEQRLRVARPVVDPSRAGALSLGRAYWREVERMLHGLVRVREIGGQVEIRLLARGPALLRLGAPQLTVAPSLVACRYAIEGGLLAGAPSGVLTLAQAGHETVELRSSVAGFHPRLAARPGRPRWTGALYPGVQARLHDAIGRRFLRRLALVGLA